MLLGNFRGFLRDPWMKASIYGALNVAGDLTILEENSSDMFEFFVLVHRMTLVDE